MKKLGKKLLLVSLSVMMLMSLSGCGKKMECEGCEEEKRCKEYEVSVFGYSEDLWLCDDCVDELDEEGIDVDKK